MQKADRILFAGGAVLIGGYFLLLTHQAVHGYFSNDDMMNLYRSWSFPLATLIRDNVFFFVHSPFYRPMGSAWYRSIFYFAGFHPQPFKVVNLIFLLANLFLTYTVSNRLSKSRTIGALTTLLASYHSRFIFLYFDTGYIYDVLCYFFYFAALALFLRARQQGRLLKWHELAGCCALYICALNSKEMAVTLPVFMLLYELLYLQDAPLWGERRWRPVIATGAITLVFIAGRIMAPDALMARNVSYRPVFTGSRFMQTSLGFVDALFCTDHWFTALKLLLLWAAMLAIACCARSRTLWFAWLFLMLSPLPIAFLALRGAPQYYIALFGWVLYAAAAVVEAVELLLRKLNACQAPAVVRARGAALVFGIALALYPLQKNFASTDPTDITIEGPEISSIAEQLRGLYPRLPARSRLMFLNDPIPPGWANLIFIVRLSYRDESLIIDRLKGMKEKLPEGRLATYNHVFDYRGGRIIELQRPWIQEMPPAIAIKGNRPQVFHRDWVPVSGEHPARPGEDLITQAIDLGATAPAVPAGQPFPQQPLAEVTSKIEARLNGSRTDTSVQIGWPDEVNLYRLDIHIPVKMPEGMAKVTLAIGEATGPAVEIPVKPNFDYRAPTIVITDRPQVFHRDWAPVTKEHPAKPGEDVITQAIGLGATRPSVPPENPFPRTPLADVVSKIAAQVNGKPAETSVQVGWPAEVGLYRLDIRIPLQTRKGIAKLTLTINGVTGSATGIPVQ